MKRQAATEANRGVGEECLLARRARAPARGGCAEDRYKSKESAVTMRRKESESCQQESLRRDGGRAGGAAVTRKVDTNGATHAQQRQRPQAGRTHSLLNDRQRQAGGQAKQQTLTDGANGDVVVVHGTGVGQQADRSRRVGTARGDAQANHRKRDEAPKRGCVVSDPDSQQGQGRAGAWDGAMHPARATQQHARDA